jgi:hypothetical protein
MYSNMKLNHRKIDSRVLPIYSAGLYLDHQDKMQTPYVGKHLPLISPRIKFPLYSDRPLPCITPRIEYDDLQLMVRGRQDHQDQGFEDSAPSSTSSDFKDPANSEHVNTSATDQPEPAFGPGHSAFLCSPNTLSSPTQTGTRAAASPIADSPDSHRATPSFASLVSARSEVGEVGRTVAALQQPHNYDKYQPPTGQPGRPNCGGYNLENKLLHEYEWSRETFVDFQVWISMNFAIQTS